MLCKGILIVDFLLDLRICQKIINFFSNPTGLIKKSA